MWKWSLILVGILIIFSSLTYASDFGINNPELPTLQPDEEFQEPILEGANYSIDVNRSDFWITSDGDLDDVSDIPWLTYLLQFFDQWLNTTDDVEFNSVNVTSSTIHTDGNVSIGVDFNDLGKSTVCIGDSVVCSDDYAVAIGLRAGATSSGSTALGYLASATGTQSVAVGRASATGDLSTGVGSLSYAEGDSSTALGQGAGAYGDNSIAVGVGTKVNSSSGKGMALGHSAIVGGFGAISIGASSFATGDYSIAIGTNSSSTASGAICIGLNCENNKSNYVQLGSGTIYMAYDEGMINASEYCFQTGECFNETNVSQWSKGNDTRGVTLTVCASDSLNTDKCDYVCDGSNDTVEILDAINSLPSSGGKITLSEGNFNLDGQVTLVDNLDISGMGFSTFLNFSTNVLNGILIPQDITNVQLHDLKVANNKVAGGGNGAILLEQGTDNIHLYNLHITSLTIGLVIEGGWALGSPTYGQLFIHDNYISINSSSEAGELHDGIYIFNRNNLKITDNYLECDGGSWCGRGIYTSGESINYVINNNIINSFDDDSIYLGYLDDSVISFNIITNGSGIKTQYGSDNLLISNNDISLLDGKSGIYLDDSHYSLITNNRIHGSTGAGAAILLIDSTHNVIQSNLLLNNSNIISETGTSGNNTIVGNYPDASMRIQTATGQEIKMIPEGTLTMTLYPENTTFHNCLVLNGTTVCNWTDSNIGSVFSYTDHFDQELNTSDEVTFSTITATNLSDGNLVMTGGVISGAIAIGGATQLDFRIGGNPQFYLNDGNIIPQVDNNIDLGDSTHEFKDAYFDGVVYTDSVYSPTGGTAIDFAIGGADQISLTDGALTPITDNDIALGNGTHGFSDLFLGNTARIYSSGGTIMAGITVT